MRRELPFLNHWAETPSGTAQPCLPPAPRRLSVLASTLMVLLVAAGCASAADAPAAPSIVQSNSAFAVDLYQRETGRAGNLFFSPYSISTALAMTFAGARGETERQMAQVLHFAESPEGVARAFAGLSKELAAIEQAREVQLSIANSLWCQQDYPFNRQFLKLARQDFAAQARQVNFHAQPEATIKEINDWVAHKTQDKIQNLMQPGDINDQTRLVLCNAVYFKGQWAAQFEKSKTRPAPFFTAPNKPVETPMMWQRLALRSKELDGFYLLDLPYTNHALSMVILLPKAVDGLPAMEKELNAAQLNGWLADLEGANPAKAEVFLPKFKLACRLELAQELAAMGMASAFGPQANFSGLSARGGLCINAVVHQAMVDVNEEGTEAAAATGVAVRSMAIARPMIPVFRVDHPFLFLLRENQTGTILFLGRVEDPTR